MADQELEVWCADSVPDAIKGNSQKRTIRDSEWSQGWLRLQGVTAQQMNMILNLLSSYAPPADVCPYPFPEGGTIPSNALQMNGQILDEDESPVLFATYGTYLTDMTDSNIDGFIWIIRNH